MHKTLILFLFSLKIPWLLGSIYSGTQNICSLSECSCISQVVECICTKNSTFQEYLQFRDDRRNLHELILRNCKKIVLPPQSISPGSNLKSIQILQSGQVELKTESIAVSRLNLVNISHVESVVFRQQTFQSFNDDSPSVAVHVSNATSVNIEGKAFASIKSLHLANINSLNLEPSALKLKVPTQEPTIVINMTKVSIKSLASSAFATSLKKILITDSSIDRIETNAFSGISMSHVRLEGVEVNRVERGAFSDQSVIQLLEFDACQISSMAKKSIVAGISELNFENSFVQSISKYGAVNATVASVRIVNNTFRTLGQESLSLESWNSIIMTDNTIQFMEEGALNAIHAPMHIDNNAPTFQFARNEVQNANRHSLVTRIPDYVSLVVADNRFSHQCNCHQEKYLQSLTGFSGLSSSFQDLSVYLVNTSSCGIPPGMHTCFPSSSPPAPTNHTPIALYEELMCVEGQAPPPCILEAPENGEESGIDGGGQDVEVYSLNQFYDDFLVLFQVKTNKGILLFLLFCVLSCVCILSICVGSIWIHRLYKRAKLMKSNKLSGSFQFNSQGEKAEILRYGSNHTSDSSRHQEHNPDMLLDEPQYAEIAEIHPPPTAPITSTSPHHHKSGKDNMVVHEYSLRRNLSLPGGGEGGDTSSSDLEATTLTDLTTLPKSGMTTLPSSLGTATSTLPLSSETDRLLPKTNGFMSGTIGGPPIAESTPLDKNKAARRGGAADSIRMSMSETSLTDEIMMALRDRLNDPTLYCTVMDAKTGGGGGVCTAGNGGVGAADDDLYAAPIYNDPSPTKT